MMSTHGQCSVSGQEEEKGGRGKMKVGREREGRGGGEQQSPLGQMRVTHREKALPGISPPDQRPLIP